VSRFVLAGGTVVTSLAPPLIVRADVAIADGRILGVSTAPPGAEVLDCGGCLVLPGLVCAHHHLYSTLARGMPYGLESPRNFTQILRRVWWRLDRSLDPEAVWWSAFIGTAGALLAGTTTIVDHHASPNAIEGSLDQVGAALTRLGARGIICYEVTDRDGPERAIAGLDETRRFAEHREALPGGQLLRPMVGAHASFTLSDDTLAGCVEAAGELGVGIHVHVAEDAADQRDSLARTGKRVVRRLADAGAIDDRALLAHCIHLDDEELELLNASGATAVTNPRSNMNNGVGHPSLDRFERLAIGTDGIGGDLFAEAQAGYWRGREADLQLAPQWAMARLAASARFAGAAFGEPKLGRIEEGAPADVVVLEYAPPTPLHGENVAGHVVFGLSSQSVRDVFVAGEPVVRDRRLVREGPSEPSGGAAEVAEGLWRRMRDIEEHPFEPVGGA
jgi:putative selenium metabolism protein SsnA